MIGPAGAPRARRDVGLTSMIAQVVHGFEAPGGNPLTSLFRAVDRRPRLPQHRLARAHHPLRVGLFVPTSGAAGIWGPSTIACARVAADELNRAGGVEGREVSLLVVDAASENTGLLPSAAKLLPARASRTISGSRPASPVRIWRRGHRFRRRSLAR